MTDLHLRRDDMRDWSDLSLQDRKRRAARALGTRDHEELWSLARAHLLFRGRKGTSTAERTLTMYRIAVLELLDRWSDRDLLRPGDDSAQDHVRWLEAGDTEAGIAPKAASTVRQRVAAARRLYEALAWCGFEIDNPFRRVVIRPDPTEAHEKREEYEIDVVRQLVATARRIDDRRTCAVILLGALAGLRIAEIAALRWPDVLWSESLLRVHGKGGKTRYAPLGSDLAQALRALPRRADDDHVLIKDRGRGPYSTDSLRLRIDRLCIEAFGVDPATGKGRNYRAAHSLRHTFGVFMHENVGLLELKAMMGHANVATTATYSKMTSRKASQKAQAAQARLADGLRSRSGDPGEE